MPLPTAAEMIRQLGLQPLPVEGTLFRATYRGAGCSSMIGLYSAEPRSHSLFHRLPVDELWLHQGGDALRLLLLHPGGRCQTLVLGPDAAAGQQLQAVVPAGVWQAGEWLPGGVCGWALFACVVAPPFEPGMFQGADAAMLLSHWPAAAEAIERLACPPGALAMPPLG
jgi:predicted cupin superfamily sugar epimerase